MRIMKLFADIVTDDEGNEYDFSLKNIKKVMSEL